MSRKADNVNPKYEARNLIQICTVFKAEAAMTKIQMTETFHNLFRTFENYYLGHCLEIRISCFEFHILMSHSDGNVYFDCWKSVRGHDAIITLQGEEGDEISEKKLTPRVRIVN